MKIFVRSGLIAVVLAAVLSLAACGQSDTGGGADNSGGEQSAGETTEPTGMGGMQGMEESTGSSGMDHGEMDMGSEEMARQMLTENGEYSDESFIDMMVPHHRGAIEEAEVALENAEHEELRGLARGIVSSQEEEIGEMRDIKEDEYGTREVPMQMSGEDMDMMGMMEDPQALADEDPFDRAFMNMMIPHHESAIAMAQVALDESENPEIRGLARGIVGSQQREIEQMQTWSEEWYPEG